MRYTFTDDSYIEENTKGLIYVGEVANNCGHIIRKTNCTLEVFIKAFEEQVKETASNMLAKGEQIY